MPKQTVAALDPAGQAVCEFEIIDTGGEMRRIDRLVRVGSVTWVIDYKWSVGPARRADCVAPLAAYRTLVAELDPPALGAAGPVRTVHELVLVDGRTDAAP
jgi:hypothetical protein